MRLGFAGRIAAAFINSKITPLLILASLLLGLWAVSRTPREEEPQIVVPMIDVFVQMPGASAKEVEQRVTKPMEKLIWEISGVRYVYSTSKPGLSMVTARFLVGADENSSLVKLREKLQSHYDQFPPGASTPLIQLRSINDVPILALTFWSDTETSLALRQVAARVLDKIKEVPDVSETKIIGGRIREFRVDLSRTRLAAFNVAPNTVAGVIMQRNQKMQPGSFSTGNQHIAVEAGNYIASPQQLSSIVIGMGAAGPIFLRDVAHVYEGSAEAKNYVFYTDGAGQQHGQKPDAVFAPAVTISVAKRKGTNAITVVDEVLKKMKPLYGALIPSDVHMTITRNYGKTALEKSNELLFHMLMAVLSVTILIALVLGWRESMVVLIAIPVTLALTLTIFYFYGYTLNRITLFALIFSIGILVDDAIVVVENIVRHLRMPPEKRRPPLEAAIYAVDEVGNPTILATFAVIAAVFPMAFVGGMMGPYMRPIPLGSSGAMLFSLLVAFIITPWAAIRILGKHAQKTAEHGGHKHQEGAMGRGYRWVMTPMIRSPFRRWTFFTLVVLALLASIALLPTKHVLVKMLPFDNKSEFQIIIDMPKGTPLAQTAAATQAIQNYLRKVPEVINTVSYIGTSGPYNFNGLVRHYFLRRGADVADIQVNLLPKSERTLQSHDVARKVRPPIDQIAQEYHANVKVAEVPPGPPVLSTLVAEIYGPTFKQRLHLARQVRNIFRHTPGVVDVDWMVDHEQPTVLLKVDPVKAALSGVSVADAQQALSIALSGQEVGLAHIVNAREDVPIWIQFPRAERSGVNALQQVFVTGQSGAQIPLSEIVKVEQVPTDRSRMRKNLKPVVYVIGDVAGGDESPIYAILKMNPQIARLQETNGAKVQIYGTHAPFHTDHLSVKWDGEWHITYEVFRDLGIAFGAVLILIYIMVVAWFQSFTTPLVILAPIPLTLIGILPGHWMLHAYFTATSMIGFIAGAGIIVRNSIILVDFIELRLKEGASLEDAVIDAGAIRARPILLTAAAVVLGAFQILPDPIFQGLAISLMAGAIASTLVSQISVPLLYYVVHRKSGGTQRTGVSA